MDLGGWVCGCSNSGKIRGWGSNLQVLRANFLRALKGSETACCFYGMVWEDRVQ